MSNQDFIFSPGLWLGEGKISFKSSSEFLKFYTKWEIQEKNDGVMAAVQIVEIFGIDEHVINHYTFSDIQAQAFKVTLENDMVGRVTGKGLREERVIAWEFGVEMSSQGFEVYERQELGDYFFHAEYGAPEQYRTLVEGLIWKKGS
jgi:hypothetical protein